jgi:UDP-2,3-diacylglucosamine hydrolase
MDDRIGLIAGSGQFPVIFARAAVEKGWRIHAAAYKNETDPILGQYVSSLEWFYVGQIKKIINYFRSHRVTQAVMMGAISKPKMFTHIRPDAKAIAMIAGMRHTNDDALLRRFADILQEEGIYIKSSTFLLPEMLAPAGVWTRRQPSKKERKDIELGWSVAKEIGRLDIGQCIVIRDGSVLAVEAIEGTDATISRGGKLGRGRAVVVKVCKPNQDMRFDVPAVGIQTVETMHAAGVQTLSVEAGKAVVFDRPDMIKLADKYKMSIVAIKEEDHGQVVVP